MPKHHSKFENIYDKHSAPLYGVTLKILQNTRQAEETLIQSFKTFFQENIIPEDEHLVFIDLLRITIGITSQKTNLTKKEIGNLIFKDLKEIRKTELA